MERGFLEKCLEDGLTLREIGRRVGKDHTTVGYWLKKHGLTATHAEKYAPKRSGLTSEQLQGFLDTGASLREIADELGLSVSTVRYWLKRFDLIPTWLGRRRQQAQVARAAGMTRLTLECRRHGQTVFILEGRGYYRCARCRAEAVVKWRRSAKRRLVRAAGGACAICGYDTYQGALQFHHLDPESKRFVVSRGGATRSFDEAKAEADRCVLLCANCHAEVEAGLAVAPSIAEAARVSTG